MPVAYRLAVVSHTLYGQDAIKWFYKSIISTAFVDNINKKNTIQQDVSYTLS